MHRAGKAGVVSEPTEGPLEPILKAAAERMRRDDGTPGYYSRLGAEPIMGFDVGRDGGTVTFYRQPKYRWAWSFCGNTWWNVEEGKEPNRFRRLMQRLVLGIVWKELA